ncbi:restriction endonuclease subunit S [Mucilaginibacter terrae]|uniref:Type I restriction enzyme S subunit n=1 Tax=Mucilaginibacter terrae TaxID=1955052 RepID=A0ABU3GXD8_9SPHI|nr:restriction endonuclease subunit S [Mucilaginibacter terrae]MDT3404261.1 type I restriction enzyme S subunit [Mucilaginibacter terrae]
MDKWKLFRLGDILTESKIESVSPNIAKRIRVKLNVGGVEKRPDIIDKQGATKYYIRRAGQFIYGKQNLEKGAFGIVPDLLDGYESSSDIPAFDIDKVCYPEWIYYFFKQDQFYLKLKTFSKGVGSKRIHFNQLINLIIPIPPKPKQREIIDYIQDLEAKSAKAINESNYQSALIEKLSKNIVDDAIVGNSTKSWRNSNLEASSATELVRESLHIRAKLLKSKKINRELLLPSITKDDNTYKLPKNWTWCRLEAIMHIAGGVTKGKIYNEPLINTPYLRVANVQRNFLDLTNVKEIAVPKSDLNKYQLKFGDLLMAEGGDADKVGRAALWKCEIPECIHQNHIFRARKFINKISEEYILIFINSSFNNGFYERSAKQTTNLASINKTVVRSTPIALPPYEEQLKIVNIVNNAMETINALKHQIEQIKIDSTLLLQLRLSEIFGDYEGKLDVRINKLSDLAPSIANKIKVNIPKFNIDNLTMELLDILKIHGKTAAGDLWKMSIYKEDVDEFYAALKKCIESDKTVKEVDGEKGYLELA